MSRPRTFIVVALMVCAVLLLALPAGAGVTGPCEGKVTIDGIEYTPANDTRDNPIVVPADREGLRIPYEGAVTVQNTNYLGAVGVVVGPATINVADWGFDENPDDVRSTTPGSFYILGNELNNIVGLYQLTAFHDADGGNCDATAMVKLEGSPLSSMIGLAAVSGAVLSGIGVASAGVKRKT